MDTRIAASAYADYVAEHGAEHVPKMLVRLLSEQLDLGDGQWDVETSAKALARFGIDARPALPALRRAAERTYTHVQRVERETAKIRAVVLEAIHEIEG